MSIAKKGLSGKLSAFLKDQSWRDDCKKGGSAQIVCLRGCRINDDGSISAHGDPTEYTDRYDDVMVVFGYKPGGSRYLETFRASAKPGRAWIRSQTYAASNKGCPTVQPGQYKYVRGLHRRTYRAMRQANDAPVCVIRDLDQDGRLELSDLVDYPKSTGINIHAGGTSDRVGRNSSGCQIIWGGYKRRPWTTFRSLVYNAAKPQKVFHYTVVDFLFFAGWHDNPDERRTRYSVLRFGARGARVKNLQKLLAAAGYYGSNLIDGDFGRVTDEGVRCYQNRNGLTCDGAVRQDMMRMLGA